MDSAITGAANHGNHLTFKHWRRFHNNPRPHPQRHRPEAGELAVAACPALCNEVLIQDHPQLQQGKEP
jgi:hypothetical protein